MMEDTSGKAVLPHDESRVTAAGKIYTDGSLYTTKGFGDRTEEAWNCVMILKGYVVMVGRSGDEISFRLRYV